MIRSLIVGAVVFGLMLIAVCIAAALAVQEPSFYTRLKAQEFAVDVKAFVRSEGAEFDRWLKDSIQSQQQQLDSDIAPVDSPIDTYTLQLSEDQLNGILASDIEKTGDVRHPRIGLSDGSMQIGAEVDVNDTSIVASIALRPYAGTDGRLRLEIQSSHIGNLRFPLQTLLSMLQDQMTNISGDLELDLSGTKPVLILNTKRGKEKPTIQSVRCQTGQLEITFQAPEITQDAAIPEG
ncbi:MAG: hypothetical protein ABJZ55_16910 [Fuerstiella sp.]